MEKKIAVLWDQEKKIASIQEADELVLYYFSEGKWFFEKSLNITGLFAGGVAQIRNKTIEIIRELGECRIIAGRNITGVIYNVLDSEGFIISELDELAEEQLDLLYTQIVIQLKEIEREKKEEILVPTAPLETEVKGDYFFDFSLLKNSTANYSSKSTIIPFLNTVDYKHLEIICNHVMPWFEEEMKKRKLYYSIKERDDKKVSILIEGA